MSSAEGDGGQFDELEEEELEEVEEEEDEGKERNSERLVERDRAFLDRLLVEGTAVVAGEFSRASSLADLLHPEEGG